jgi:hypothetical protein
MVLHVERFAHPEIDVLKKQLSDFLINKTRDNIIQFECSNNIAWIIWDDEIPDRVESLNMRGHVTNQTPLPKLPQEQHTRERRSAPYIDKSC